MWNKGSFINHVATKGGRGGRKSPKIGYVIGVKLTTLGGRGSEITQKMATWFMNDP